MIMFARRLRVGERIGVWQVASQTSGIQEVSIELFKYLMNTVAKLRGPFMSTAVSKDFKPGAV
jgi:hypothetical protein